MKKTHPLCACGQHPIEEQFGTCIDCFAKRAVVYEALTQIGRDYGIVTALAARPVLEKAAETGWREEYRAEFEANLTARIEQETKGNNTCKQYETEA